MKAAVTSKNDNEHRRTTDGEDRLKDENDSSTLKGQ